MKAEEMDLAIVVTDMLSSEVHVSSRVREAYDMVRKIRT